MLNEERDLSPLELEFETACTAAYNEVDEHIQAAQEAIRKAVEVAEKYGVPIEMPVCPLHNGYIPRNFSDKFGDLDEQFISDVSGVYSEYGYHKGWVHSSIC